MTVHCMLDLETMGLAPTGAIVQIGAVAFTDEVVFEDGAFRRSVDLGTSLDIGMTVDGSTVDWWLDQEPDPRTSLLLNRETISQALTSFSTWYRMNKCETLWCHATFDAVILDQAYRLAKMRPPFHYRDVRDLRTLRALHPSLVDAKYEELQGTGRFMKHYAPDDAKLQAHVAKAVLEAHFLAAGYRVK